MSDQTPDINEAQKPNVEMADDIDDRRRIARMEVDLSRLRSALCLLVKDEPDMLRLLGCEPASPPEKDKRV